MDLDQLQRAADANLIATWTAMSNAMGGATGGTDGCRFAASGLPAAPFNGAVLTEPLDDPVATLHELSEFMADLAVPYLLWCREGLDDATVEAAHDQGFTEAGIRPAMALRAIASVPRVPDGATVERVDDDAGVGRFRDLMEHGFGLPREFADRLVVGGTTALGSFASAIVWVGGEPVACALASLSSTTIGIYNVATLPAYRGQGWGTAATWAAIELGAERGGTHAVLQSSDMGLSVYRAMGFEQIGRYLQLAPTSADDNQD